MSETRAPAVRSVTAETYLINQPTDQPFIDRCNPSHVAPIQTGPRCSPPPPPSPSSPVRSRAAAKLSALSIFPLSYNANYFSPKRSISASSSARYMLTNLREIIKSFNQRQGRYRSTMEKTFSRPASMLILLIERDFFMRASKKLYSIVRIFTYFYNTFL